MTLNSPPRHSSRLAAKSRRRASNPTVQVQNVLMLKWGCTEPAQVQPEDDAAAFDEYQALYGVPLSESKQEALRALFSADNAISNIQLLEGVELELQ